MRVSPERLAYWAPRAFLGVGVVLLVVTAVLVVLTVRFVAEAERADGTVVALDRVEDEDDADLYYPVVKFTTADGRTIEFRSSSGSSPPSHSEGDSVEVLYDPDDPQDARLSGFMDLWFAPLVCAALGTVFTAIGVYIVRPRRKRRKGDIQSLRSRGRLVQGTSPRVVHCDDVEVQGRSPFRVDVDVHVPAENQVRVLTSDYVWFDPTPYLEGRKSLNVYVDRHDRERYLVDISFLPRLAE
jgi:Protein of unknown function (DUF3592)